jgi:hypothetical protein
MRERDIEWRAVRDAVEHGARYIGLQRFYQGNPEYQPWTSKTQRTLF